MPQLHPLQSSRALLQCSPQAAAGQDVPIIVFGPHTDEGKEMIISIVRLLLAAAFGAAIALAQHATALWPCYVAAAVLLLITFVGSFIEDSR